MSLVFYKGKYLNSSNAFVSVDNRSFRYGDGFFETIKCVNGCLPLWVYHAARIDRTLKAMHFAAPVFFTTDYIKEHIHTLLKKNQHEGCGRVRVTIFRGEGGIYDSINHRPELLIQTWPLNKQNNLLNENGLDIGIYDDGFKAADKLANLKSNNYLLYAMAALKVKQAHWNDTIILNHKGSLADATIANCWLIKDGVIKTPPLQDGPVAGNMRQYLLDHFGANGFEYEESSLFPEDLSNADEVFLSNAIYGVRWVGSFGNKKFGNQVVSSLFAKLVAPLWTSTI